MRLLHCCAQPHSSSLNQPHPILIAVGGKAQFSMLGLGDIVIPGIFVAIVLRYDVAHAARGARYFYRCGGGQGWVGGRGRLASCSGLGAWHMTAHGMYTLQVWGAGWLGCHCCCWPSLGILQAEDARWSEHCCKLLCPAAALLLPAARLPAMRRACSPPLW